nr:MAG TPA: hypothetical protein [Caudoviricetes sp.]
MRQKCRKYKIVSQNYPPNRIIFPSVSKVWASRTRLRKNAQPTCGKNC